MRIFPLLFICIINFTCFSQERTCIWYNVENAFDYIDDSLTYDESFLPEGDYRWTSYKYYQKIKRIGRALLIASENKPIDFIGLCEIENAKVVDDIIYNSPLEGLHLKSVHCESPDRRGIDVALLYNPKTFEVLKNEFVRVVLPDTSRRTRDILYCKGIYRKKDTLSIFLNHWPSKYGGAVSSVTSRVAAKNCLVNSIRQFVDKNDKVIIMGDFNETEVEPAVRSFFAEMKIEGSPYYNLVSDLEHARGSYKYQGVWQFIDQVWLSEAMYRAKTKCFIQNVEICKNKLLLESDNSFTGQKPFRTFSGFKYNGGYSDHLPTVITLGYK